MGVDLSANVNGLQVGYFILLFGFSKWNIRLLVEDNPLTKVLEGLIWVSIPVVRSVELQFEVSFEYFLVEAATFDEQDLV